MAPVTHEKRVTPYCRMAERICSVYVSWLGMGTDVVRNREVSL
jgi:hypothetical protein